MKIQDVSGYGELLEFFGALVHECKTFGDYQGRWIAHVTYDGETGFVTYYERCGERDSFLRARYEGAERLEWIGSYFLKNLIGYVEMMEIAKSADDWDIYYSITEFVKSCQNKIKAVYGVRPMLPAKGFPDGRIRFRMRDTDFMSCVVRVPNGDSRRFFVGEDKGFFYPAHEFGCNRNGIERGAV